MTEDEKAILEKAVEVCRDLVRRYALSADDLRGRGFFGSAEFETAKAAGASSCVRALEDLFK